MKKKYIIGIIMGTIFNFSTYLGCSKPIKEIEETIAKNQVIISKSESLEEMVTNSLGEYRETKKYLNDLRMSDLKKAHPFFAYKIYLECWDTIKNYGTAQEIESGKMYLAKDYLEAMNNGKEFITDYLRDKRLREAAEVIDTAKEINEKIRQEKLINEKEIVSRDYELDQLSTRLNNKR